MARKKSFLPDIENPAMNFISQESIDKVEKGDNPPLKAPREKPPKGFKVNPVYVEVKSKRVQLVLQPSLYDKVKKASVEDGLSFNEYVHRLLEDAIEERENR